MNNPHAILKLNTDIKVTTCTVVYKFDTVKEMNEFKKQVDTIYRSESRVIININEPDQNVYKEEDY